MALLQAPNRLVYPAGVSPAFNPSHIAANNTRISVIATGAGGYNVLNGLPSSAGPGAPTAAIDGVFGNCINCAVSTGQGVQWSNLKVSSGPPPITFGAFVRFTSTPGGALQFICAIGNSNGAGIGIQSGIFVLNKPVVDTTALTLTATAGVPYFVAVSADNTTVINLVVKRLDTGVIRTSKTLTALGMGAPSALFTFGQQGGNAAGGVVPCAMYAESYLTLTQLLSWAQDPWSFWYPSSFNILNMVQGAQTPAFTWVNMEQDIFPSKHWVREMQAHD